MKLESIGKNIRRFRKERGYRLEDLAEMVGLSANYMGAIERGEKQPSLETFIAIVNCLGTSADFILADILTESYQVKESLLSEKLRGLSPQQRKEVYAGVDALLQTFYSK